MFFGGLGFAFSGINGLVLFTMLCSISTQVWQEGGNTVFEFKLMLATPLATPCQSFMCYWEASYLESWSGHNVSLTLYLLIQYKGFNAVTEVLEQPFILSCHGMYA